MIRLIIGMVVSLEPDSLPPANQCLDGIAVHCDWECDGERICGESLASNLRTYVLFLQKLCPKLESMPIRVGEDTMVATRPDLTHKKYSRLPKTTKEGLLPILTKDLRTKLVYPFSDLNMISPSPVLTSLEASNYFGTIFQS